jgi:hypothetical protein
VYRLVEYKPYGSNSTENRWDKGGFWNYSVPATGALPSGLVNRAEQAALLDLKNQDINLGQFLAELDQTIRLVTVAALRIGAAARFYRRTDAAKWRQVKRWQRGCLQREFWSKIPRSWLEVQYGWKPLMSDIFGAAAHLSGPSRLPLVHVKGNAKDTTEASGIWPARVGSSKVNYKCLTHHRVDCNLWYQLQSPVLAEFSSLGLVNPLEIVWELTPYSFVVDWFLPIGNWLSSLTADVGFAFKSGSLSKLSKTGDLTVTGVDWESGSNASSRVKYYGEYPKMIGESFNFSRTCYPSSPVPGIYVKNPISATHMLNAISLLWLAFERRKTRR